MSSATEKNAAGPKADGEAAREEERRGSDGAPLRVATLVDGITGEPLTVEILLRALMGDGETVTGPECAGTHQG